MSLYISLFKYDKSKSRVNHFVSKIVFKKKHCFKSAEL